MDLMSGVLENFPPKGNNNNMYWKSKFKQGDKVKVVKESKNSVTMVQVGQICTLKSQTKNDISKKLWTTEENEFWCVSESNIEKIK